MQRAWLLGALLGMGAGCTGQAGLDGDPARSLVQDAGSGPAEARARARDGELGPLIPFHKDAIHAGLFWDPAGKPKMLFLMRPAEYWGTALVDPDIGPTGMLRETFRELVYGAFSFSERLDGSNRNWYKPDIERENTLIFDLTHPDAFANRGKYRIEDLDDEDIALNAAAFSDAGHSAGLHYNLFCAGQAVLPDSRWVFVGGHDKGGNNGIRKVVLFDPRTATWTPRLIPPVKADFLEDPTGEAFPHADPMDEANTDPPHPSDMRYQRWYPTALTLPDGKVLILSGTDQDTSVGPDLAPLTKVRKEVPEVYDPGTDRTIALENARKLHPMYPRSFVVQTGRRKHDWQVAVIGEVKPPLPTGDELADFDPWRYNGNTNLLDVQAALADPDRDEPAECHWTLLATARYAHESGASAALWKLDDKGDPISQRVLLIGGDSGDGEPVASVEMIDFSDLAPGWEELLLLVRPATQNHAVALPDGKVLVVGGRGGARDDAATLTFEYQLIDPQARTIRTVAETTVPRHDHATALLAPDGSVLVMGGNRTDLVLDDTEEGVPVLQVYKPAYMFQGDRPRIARAPERISYRRSFPVELAAGCGKTGSVVVMRMEPVTHNWSWGNRYVELAFDEVGKCRLNVRAPATGAAAPPGDYMLFVLDERGVPSEGRHLVIR